MISRARDFPRAAFDRTWYSLTEQSEAPNIPLSGVLRLYKAVGARGGGRRWGGQPRRDLKSAVHSYRLKSQRALHNPGAEFRASLANGCDHLSVLYAVALWQSGRVSSICHRCADHRRCLVPGRSITQKKDDKL